MLHEKLNATYGETSMPRVLDNTLVQMLKNDASRRTDHSDTFQEATKLLECLFERMDFLNYSLLTTTVGAMGYAYQDMILTTDVTNQPVTQTAVLNSHLVKHEGSVGMITYIGFDIYG